MSKETKSTIEAKGVEISVRTNTDQMDFFCLTDIARYKNPEEPFIVVNNWMRLRNTIEYIGLWEQLHNPNFIPIEFDRFLSEAGTNAFTLSPQKWINATNAVGIISKTGRNGGTFAISDIALKFAAWLSVELELYIVKDYQRLKSDESRRLQFEWSAKRELSKVNYKIHTDAIKAHLIPETLTPQQISFTYASEADMLSVAGCNMISTEVQNNFSKYLELSSEQEIDITKNGTAVARLFGIGIQNKPLSEQMRGLIYFNVDEKLIKA